MDLQRLRDFMSQHRTSVKDVTLIIVIMLVATYYAWRVDVFKNGDYLPPKEQTLEVDELLLLGGILMTTRSTFR